MTTHPGSCRCGSVSMKATGSPQFSGYCHCDDCRRSNGAPIVSFAGFGRAQVEWKSQERLAEWNNGPFTRMFCKACGSPVAYADQQVSEIVFFYTGFMKDPSAFPPDHHSYYNEKLDWVQLSDTLERFEKTSYPRPE